MKLSDIKENPDNPRTISTEKLEILKKSISEFPKMMKLRPIVIDKNNMVLGGNMRLKALQELEFKEIPDEWIKHAEELTKEEKKRFIITDNLSGGEWNWDTLHTDWDIDLLEHWGLEVLEIEEQEELQKGEIQFSTELDFEANYVVLKFVNDIDWIHAKTVLNLDSTHSKRQNGKPWSKGIGRVVDGIKTINLIKEYKENEN